MKTIPVTEQALMDRLAFCAEQARQAVELLRRIDDDNNDLSHDDREALGEAMELVDNVRFWGAKPHLTWED